MPIVEDIRDVDKIKEIVADATKPKGSVDRQILCISESRQRSGIGKQEIEPQPSLLVTAGFPCQPFSVAGKRRGERDDYYLWPETLAAIKAIKPKWALLENVTGIINLAVDTVLSDLEGAGYATETLIIPACAVNAPHRRDRVWIVAHSQGTGQSPEPERRQDSGKGGQEIALADTQREGLEGADTEGDSCRGGQPCEYRKGEWQTDWWAVEPELGRVAYGIPNRVDRLKCLGNAIVPQVAFEIIRVIKELES